MPRVAGTRARRAACRPRRSAALSARGAGTRRTSRLFICTLSLPDDRAFFSAATAAADLHAGWVAFERPAAHDCAVRMASKMAARIASSSAGCASDTACSGRNHEADEADICSFSRGAGAVLLIDVNRIYYKQFIGAGCIPAVTRHRSCKRETVCATYRSVRPPGAARRRASSLERIWRGRITLRNLWKLL